MLEFVTWWPLVAVGAIVGGKWAWDAWAIVFTILSKRFLPKSLAERYGRDSYVLITGSTDGLGKAFALEVAQRGLNLVLVSRNPAKLAATRNEILAAHPKIKVEVFALDFSGLFKPNKVAELAQFTQNLDISVVVNNVGVAYEKGWDAQLYATKDAGVLVDMVSTNILSQLLMHLHFGKRLSARRHRSAFLDVSSVAVSCFHPSNDVYSATKVFNWYFTNSIHNSRDFASVDYLSYLPAMMRTNMITHMGVQESFVQKLLIKSPRTSAAEALDALGVVSNTNGNFLFFAVHTAQRLLNYLEWTPLFRVLWDRSAKMAMGLE